MTRETAIEEIKKRTGLKDYHILAVYMYGSRVYGNARKDSDWDFIVVTQGGSEKAFNHSMEPADGLNQFSDNLININFYSLMGWADRLTACEPSALECVYLPDEFILRNDVMGPVNARVRRLMGEKEHRNLVAIRHAFSAKASNSWVKAKKKLTVEKDYNDLVGKKSLWHSIRIIDFGIQILEKGSIDYGSCNWFYDEVMYCKDWTEMYDKYKLMYNAKLTEFRKLAPKE